MDLKPAETLLAEFQSWYTVDQRAKRLYQAQLAPDFRLMMYLQRNENALSTYLSMLLDINGAHGQGDLYLTKFLALLPDTDFASPQTFSKAHTEFRLPNNRRIDLYLQFNNGGLAIENKPWAGDQKHQLLDYANHLMSKHGEGHWQLVYLCNWQIGEYTLPQDRAADFINHITLLDFFTLARWLEDCAACTRAPAVRLFVEALTVFVREQINGELQVENAQELTKLILSDYQSLRAAFQISQQLQAAKRELWHGFEAYLRQQLSHLGAQLVFEDTLVDGAPHSKFGIKFSEGDPCGPSWAFNNRNHQALYFGVSAWDHDDIVTMQGEAIRKAMDAFCGLPSSAPTQWWPWWTHTTQAFSANTVHSHWNTEPQAWLDLQDHSAKGFAAQIISTAERFKSTFNLALLHKTV